MDTTESKIDLISTPAIALMRAHRSIRAYTPQPVPDAMIMTIIEAAQWASSSSFRQQYSVIAIRDVGRKRQLSELCGSQRWIEECPVFLAFCADSSRLDDICKIQGKRANLERTETFLMAALDVALFMQNVALAAESLGLGMVMIGGLRNHPREVIHLLELPPGVVGIAGMCLGFPETQPRQRPRLPLNEVLHWEGYNSVNRAENLAAYDETLRTAGTYRKKDGTQDGWSDAMARSTSKPPAEEGRYQLRQILQEQGFAME